LLEFILSRWGYEVVVASSGSEAWDIINSKSAPQIAILDWMMPGMEGVEVCRKIRQLESGTGRYTYIILLTVKKSREDFITGMESGADDYVFKPFDQRELGVRILVGRRIIELQNRIRGSSEEEDVVFSKMDSLTGIFNREAVYEVLAKEILRSERVKTPFSIIVLDIDFFKKLNDSRGSDIGDAVLKEIVRRIRAELRPYDTFGRLGGDEFIILLPGAFMYEVLAVAKRIQGVVHKTPFDITPPGLPVTASFGVAEFDFKEKSDSLISRANAALSKAKSNGGNRIEN